MLWPSHCLSLVEPALPVVEHYPQQVSGRRGGTLRPDGTVASPVEWGLEAHQGSITSTTTNCTFHFHCTPLLLPLHTTLASSDILKERAKPCQKSTQAGVSHLLYQNTMDDNDPYLVVLVIFLAVLALASPSGYIVKGDIEFEKGDFMLLDNHTWPGGCVQNLDV